MEVLKRAVVWIAGLTLAGGVWAQPARIAVAPVVLTAPAKFAGPDRPRTAEIMDLVAAKHMAKVGDANDVFFVPTELLRPILEDEKIDFAKGNQRTGERLQIFGKAANARYAVLAVVEWTDQKNPELSAVSSNPGTAKSTNRVKIRLWIHDVVENRLLLDGAKEPQIEGEAKGPYFGTVDPREMSADPETKGLVMTAGFKKRAEWLGYALVDALRKSLQARMGWRDPA